MAKQLTDEEKAARIAERKQKLEELRAQREQDKKERENMTNSNSNLAIEAESHGIVDDVATVNNTAATANWREAQANIPEVGPRPSIAWEETSPGIVMLDRTKTPNKDNLPDVVIITGQREFRAINTIFGFLDRVWPEAIFIGDNGNTDRMAMAWAKSRGREFIPVYPEWDLHGPSAGPLRNQEVLDMAREMIETMGKRVWHVFFDSPNYRPDRAVVTMFETAKQRNDFLAQDFPNMVIPLVDAEKWMETDMKAGLAKSKLGSKYDADFSDRLMIGARRLPQHPVPVEVSRS